MRTNLHHLLDEQALLRGDRPALTFADETVDYANLTASMHRLATGLGTLGLDRGDRLAILLDKRRETVESIFAASAAGLVFVPVNPLLKPAQVTHVLADCGVRVLITSKARWQQLRKQLDELPALEHVVLVSARAETPPSTDRVALHAFADLQSLGETTPAPVRPAVDLDIAAILYTSGSTGRPKGVVLSHRNLLVGAESVSTYLGNDADDVILAALPLSFDAGLSQLTTAFSVGAHVVLVNYLLPGDVPRLCAEHRVTGLTCVPPLWLQLLGVEWPEAATARLRYFANTGGRMPRHALDRLRGLFPSACAVPDVRPHRGVPLHLPRPGTRSTRGRTRSARRSRTPRSWWSDQTASSPGRARRASWCTADPWWRSATGATRSAPPSASARCRGTAESWRQPELAVWSGDTVVADEEGFLYFVGRADDMIKTSGYRVSPTEVEEAAYATGLVGDAVALGVDDAVIGQRIVLVATASGEGPLQTERCWPGCARSCPRFMVPAEIREMDVLPRSPNGKFDRVLLRKEVA